MDGRFGGGGGWLGRRRRRRTGVALGVSVALAASTLATLPASAAPGRPMEAGRRAAPTCTPGKPVVVGSAGDRLTVTVPPCSNPSGVTGYRVLVLEGTASSATDQVDVPLGTPQVEVTGLQAGTRYRFQVAALDAGGQGPAGAASTDTSPPFTTSTALVDRQYLDFNGAAATSSERATWLADLASGAKTPIDVVDAAEAFPYWQKQSPIIRLFQAYFLRLPDKTGLAYWVGKYRGGKKLSAISQDFSRSSEFVRRYGTLSNRKFVEQIYLNVLGRPGEETGIAYWTGKLDSKTRNRGEVMVGFSESSEYTRTTKEQVWTVNFFTGMLLRLPTSAEVATWKPQTRAALVQFLLGSSAYVARVGVTAPPAVVTSTLPGGTVGSAYPSTQLTSTGGRAPITWSKVSGALPPGLSLSSAGAISGTPTAGGTATFTVQVQDADGRTGTRSLSITTPALAVATTSLPDGSVSSAYVATQLNASNAYGAKTWTVSVGSLPSGLSLSTAGVISGTPSAGGTSTFTVKVQDAGGSSATKQLSITVTNFAITTTAVPDGVKDVGYAASLDAVGGGPYTWSITAGSLPAGLTLGPTTGLISGTPTAIGSSNVTIKVTGAASKTATRSYTIAVIAPSDWPQGRHDEAHRAWAAGETVITPANAAQVHQEWESETGYPVIADGTLFVSGLDPTNASAYAVTATDLATGSPSWKAPLVKDDCPGGQLVATSTALVVMCGARIQAFSRTGGHGLLWDTNDTDPGQNLQNGLVLGSSLIAWSGERVVAYRLSDGQRLWQQLLPSGASNVSDVAASGTTVVVGYNDRLRALNASTGAQVWSKASVVTSTVVVADGWIYTNDGGGVARYSLAAGAAGWSVLPASSIVGVLGADADTVYVWEAVFDSGPPSPSNIHALKASDGTERWVAGVPSRVRTFAVTGAVAWYASSDIAADGRSSDLVALDRTNGTELRTIHFDDNIYGAAAFGAGRVVLNQGGSGADTPARLRVFGLAPPLPVIDTAAISSGRATVAYSQQLAASGGAGTFTWSLAGGSLPTGVTLGADGLLAGTPSVAGTFQPVVKVTDAKGRSVSRTFTLVVAASGTAAWTTGGRSNGGNPYEPNETAINVDSVAQVSLRWKTASVAAGSQSIDGAMEPLVSGTRLYAITRDGELRAWDTTGSTTNRASLWHTPPDTGGGATMFIGAPTLAGANLYLWDNAGYAQAVRASDGVVLWRSPVQVSWPTFDQHQPLVVGTRLLFTDFTGDLRALSTADGSLSWGGTATDLPAGASNSNPSSDGTRAFITSGCTLYAVTVATGAIAWSAPISVAPVPCTAVSGRDRPMVQDGVVFARDFNTLAAFDATTGAVKWRAGAYFTYETGAVVGSTWVVQRFNPALATYDLTAYDIATGKVVWDRLVYSALYHLSGTGDLLLANACGDSACELYAFDARSGEQLSDIGATDTAGYQRGVATVNGGRIYVATAAEGVKVFGLP